MQVDEFSQCVNISKLNLVPIGVLVIWEWEWLANSTGSSDNESDEDEAQGHFNPYIQSEEEEEDAAGSETIPFLTHIVTFKCMGSTHHLHAQEALKKANRLLKEGEDVYTS